MRRGICKMLAVMAAIIFVVFIIFAFLTEVYKYTDGPYSIKLSLIAWGSLGISIGLVVLIYILLSKEK